MYLHWSQLFLLAASLGPAFSTPIPFETIQPGVALSRRAFDLTSPKATHANGYHAPAHTVKDGPLVRRHQPPPPPRTPSPPRDSPPPTPVTAANREQRGGTNQMEQRLITEVQRNQEGLAGTGTRVHEGPDDFGRGGNGKKRSLGGPLARRHQPPPPPRTPSPPRDSPPPTPVTAANREQRGGTNQMEQRLTTEVQRNQEGLAGTGTRVHEGPDDFGRGGNGKKRSLDGLLGGGH